MYRRGAINASMSPMVSTKMFVSNVPAGRVLGPYLLGLNVMDSPPSSGLSVAWMPKVQLLGP